MYAALSAPSGYACITSTSDKRRSPDCWLCNVVLFHFLLFFVFLLLLLLLSPCLFHAHSPALPLISASPHQHAAARCLFGVPTMHARALVRDTNKSYLLTYLCRQPKRRRPVSTTDNDDSLSPSAGEVPSSSSSRFQFRHK